MIEDWSDIVLSTGRLQATAIEFWVWSHFEKWYVWNLSEGMLLACPLGAHHERFGPLEHHSVTRSLYVLLEITLGGLSIPG